MDGLRINATATVKLTKIDENGKVIDVAERDILLTDKEAKDLWHSLKQE